MLEDIAYADDTSSIAANVRSALRAYFDDRPDWWTWRLDSIGGIIARADRRILTCQSPDVAARSGGSIAEPSAALPQSGNVTHWYLADDAVTLTFTTPS